MPAAFAELLEQRFRELRLFSNRERALRVATAPATYSGIINGRIGLTRKRAEAWASDLHPDDAGKAAEFARRMLSAGKPGESRVSVHQFFDRVVSAGGAVPVEQISDLFQALVSRPVENPLVLVEYRDLTRAGPAAKYQELGMMLGTHIARGLSFGMFVPFGARPAADNLAASTARYARDVHESCVSAYLSLHHEAEQERASGTKPDGNDSPGPVGDHIKLYQLREPAPGTAFQAKMFYIQFDSREGDILVRHQRIMQWVSTPTRDLLVYRGEAHIKPDALRDSFFPVPHFFESRQCLPDLPSDAVPAAVAERFIGHQLPSLFDAWESYRAPAA